MTVKFEGSVMQVGNSLTVTIPHEIAKHMDLERGDIVELWVSNHRMVMEKKVMASCSRYSLVLHEDLRVEPKYSPMKPNTNAKTMNRPVLTVSPIIS
jgi:antitoxin component of MazEF toxin-antitoxin module